MLNSKYHYPLFLAAISIWWGLTFFADLMIAPAIFQVVDNFFNAGELAMTLFSRLNSIEVILSSLVLTLLILIFRRKPSIFLLASGIVCWSFAIFYFAYLIPKIVSLTELWKQADKMGVIGIGDISDIQQEHQKFHKVYVGMDVVKLLLLSFMMIFGIVKQEKIS